MSHVLWRASARLVVLSSVSLAGCAGGGATPAAAGGARSPMAATIDSIAESRLKTGKVAGMSIGVMRGSDTIVMKGYGMADLELDVPTPPHAIYEIGSVTKQFTAASILLLRDAGKLSLDDDIHKFLPDYPTQGHTITVRRLLDHTSGIKGYTELPGFGAIVSRHLPKDSLLAMFKNVKFDFSTGDAMVYNNSAYFLAGMIIEKLSGMSYGDYVKQNLFDKVGMSDSRYCSESAIMKRKVKGYDMNPDSTLKLKGFLDHTYPFSAGSLCSSVSDLVAWNRALHNGRVLSAPSYTDLTTPGTLNDGTTLRYAKGLSLRTVGGHRLIEHGGGINGFLSASHYYPDDSLTVVVLLNTAGIVAPDKLANDIALAMLGRKPEVDEPFAGDMAALSGTYSGVGRGSPMVVTISVDGKNLMVKTEGDSAKRLRFVGNGTWELDEQHLRFVPGKGGMQLKVDQTYGYSVLGRKG